MKTLKDRLLYARELRNLTQGELAVRAKCAQSAIGNAESGERKTLRNLVLVARALKVSPDWLFDGYGPKPVKEIEPQLTFSTAQVVPMFAAEETRSNRLQPFDPYTSAAVDIMLTLLPNQREGALAALRTHVGNLSPPRFGQAL